MTAAVAYVLACLFALAGMAVCTAYGFRARRMPVKGQASVEEMNGLFVKLRLETEGGRFTRDGVSSGRVQHCVGGMVPVRYDPKDPGGFVPEEEFTRGTAIAAALAAAGVACAFAGWLIQGGRLQVFVNGIFVCAIIL